MAISHPCKKNRDEVCDRPAEALYLHVPFCAAKCKYCDFYSLEAGRFDTEKFLGALAAEMHAQAHCLAKPLASVFVGGGTPTSIAPLDLGELLAIPAGWLGRDTEFSVEANPGTLDDRRVEALLRAGVNRVNLGVQSFQADELETLGRIHSPQQASDAFNMLRQAGLRNIGLDLIYGIPGQSLPSWQASVDQALDLRPEHLSCYALSFEANTPLWRDLQVGQVEEMDEVRQEACWRYAISAAADAGLEHYEISNFARPGRQCLHNLTYWRNMPYIGLGPGAASYLGGVRRTNAPDLTAYVRCLLSGQDPPASQEQLTGRRAMAETVMLALRMTQGLDLKAFEQRYGQDARQVFTRSISRHIQTGWLEVDACHLRIPPSAMFVSNEVMADILAEA